MQLYLEHYTIKNQKNLRSKKIHTYDHDYKKLQSTETDLFATITLLSRKNIIANEKTVSASVANLVKDIQSQESYKRNLDVETIQTRMNELQTIPVIYK